MEKIKVLIIEDDENARKQLSKFVQKEGFEVLTASDGKEGIETFKKENPDIIITDLKMPNIDGMEVIYTVKRLAPNVQVILLTAFGEINDAITAIREGVLDYLKKPLDIDELLLALGRAKEKILEEKTVSPCPTILLAEDDEKTGDRLCRVLKKEKWEVFWVKDGDEALQVFQREKIDLVLLDINMPKKNGIQTLHEMRTISMDFEAIILTGYGDESNAIQALRDGAINFIRKPIELDELIMCVEKALDKLTIKRALKYRTRELELSKQIIAKFTKEREIIFDAREHANNSARGFAEEIIESLPMGMVAFDKNLNIKFVNQNVSQLFEEKPSKIDESFFKKLTVMGIALTQAALLETVKKIYEAPQAIIEKISTGKYSNVFLIPISVITETEKQTNILLLLRGERK